MIIVILFTVMLFALVFCNNAHATYLDPGSGSYIFQVIMAAVIVYLFSIKTYFKNVFCHALLTPVVSEN